MPSEWSSFKSVLVFTWWSLQRLWVGCTGWNCSHFSLFSVSGADPRTPRHGVAKVIGIRLFTILAGCQRPALFLRKIRPVSSNLHWSDRRNTLTWSDRNRPDPVSRNTWWCHSQQKAETSNDARSDRILSVLKFNLPFLPSIFKIQLFNSVCVYFYQSCYHRISVYNIHAQPFFCQVFDGGEHPQMSLPCGLVFQMRLDPSWTQRKGNATGQRTTRRVRPG